MRRGGQVSIAGAGGGGFNKPPPGPLSHASGGRMRLHTHDANGAAMKDRFGSPRERSPNLCSSLPLSPSHLNAREKSPNPTSQDLHDCSMCVSAYIQSLNTVCGTACRLAQCLAQVGADNGCNEASGTGTPLLQLLREAAEMWEGIARAVGVASTNVKNQVLILLQETQARHTVEHSESVRKLEIARIMRTMLSTFLNLHCQFSLVVMERFSGMLHLLKDENCVYSAANMEGHRPSPSPSVSPHRPSPSPPQPGTQYSHLSSQQLLHQQLLQQQQQQHLALQQQILLQQMLQMSCNKNAPTTESPSSRPEENDSRHSSGGSASALQAPVGPPLWLANLGSPVSPFSSQGSANTLSPGICAIGGMGESSGEALLRRWSMGCATSEEAWHDKPSMLSPFSLIANRRWSVPETTEHDYLGGFMGTHPFHGSDHAGGVPSGRGSQNRGFGKGNSQLISRESSCTRSPSHSRSVTPDHSRRVSVVSNEELQDVIELLSLPLNGTKEEKPKAPGVKPFSTACQKSGDDGSSSNPHHHHHHHHPHSIPENESQDLPSSPSFSTSSPRSSHDSQSSVPSEKGKSQSDASPKMFQHTPWTSENAPDERDSSCSSAFYKNIPGEKLLKENTNQISTSLWPPSDNVPGVTLTECVGESDKRVILPWSDENGCDERSNTSDSCFNRDSINRASWPISAFSCLGIVDDMLSGSHGVSQGGWASRPNVATFRRHSTDAPFLLPQGEHTPHPLSAKTRSFENIASKVNGNNNFSGSGMDSSIPDLFLPSLHSPFSSASSPASSHYTLFTTSN